jgi:hypothetical protein
VSIHLPDYSIYRRDTIVLYVRAGGLVERMTSEMLLTLVVGMLICDDEGAFGEREIMAAMCDPSVIQVARTLIEKAASEV